MEMHLDRRAIRQIRVSAQEAIEEDDTESLREDILEAFSEDQIEEIERRLDHGDMFEFLTDVIDEWGGDDVDELLELLESQLGEVGIDLKTDVKSDDEDEIDDDEDDLDDTDDEDAEFEPEDDFVDDCVRAARRAGSSRQAVSPRRSAAVRRTTRGRAGPPGR